MSDTPRTDEKALTHPWINGEAKYVAVDFARQLERENAALRADIHAHEQINRQLIEDKRRLDFLATLTGSGWACLHLNRKGTNDDWLLTRKQIDRRMATEPEL